MGNSKPKEYPILGRSVDGADTLDSKIPEVSVEQNVRMVCPYCGSSEFVRRGTRKKKHEKEKWSDIALAKRPAYQKKIN